MSLLEEIRTYPKRRKDRGEDKEDNIYSLMAPKLYGEVKPKQRKSILSKLENIKAPSGE